MAGAEGAPNRKPWLFSLAIEDGEATFGLPAELSGGNGVELRNQIISQVIGGNAIRLVFTDLLEADGDGLTPLVQAVGKARRLGAPVACTGVGEATQRLLQETGVSRFFDNPPAERKAA